MADTAPIIAQPPTTTISTQTQAINAAKAQWASGQLSDQQLLNIINQNSPTSPQTSLSAMDGSPPPSERPRVIETAGAPIVLQPGQTRIETAGAPITVQPGQTRLTPTQEAAVKPSTPTPTPTPSPVSAPSAPSLSSVLSLSPTTPTPSVGAQALALTATQLQNINVAKAQWEQGKISDEQLLKTISLESAKTPSVSVKPQEKTVGMTSETALATPSLSSVLSLTQTPTSISNEQAKTQWEQGKLTDQQLLNIIAQNAKAKEAPSTFVDDLTNFINPPTPTIVLDKDQRAIVKGFIEKGIIPSSPELFVPGAKSWSEIVEAYNRPPTIELDKRQLSNIKNWIDSGKIPSSPELIAPGYSWSELVKIYKEQTTPKPTLTSKQFGVATTYFKNIGIGDTVLLQNLSIQGKVPTSDEMWKMLFGDITKEQAKEAISPGYLPKSGLVGVTPTPTPTKIDQIIDNIKGLDSRQSNIARAYFKEGESDTILLQNLSIQGKVPSSDKMWDMIFPGISRDEIREKLNPVPILSREQKMNIKSWIDTGYTPSSPELIIPGVTSWSEVMKIYKAQPMPTAAEKAQTAHEIWLAAPTSMANIPMPKNIYDWYASGKAAPLLEPPSDTNFVVIEIAGQKFWQNADLETFVAYPIVSGMPVPGQYAVGTKLSSNPAKREADIRLIMGLPKMTPELAAFQKAQREWGDEYRATGKVPQRMVNPEDYGVTPDMLKPQESVTYRLPYGTYTTIFGSQGENTVFGTTRLEGDPFSIQAPLPAGAKDIPKNLPVQYLGAQIVKTDEGFKVSPVMGSWDKEQIRSFATLEKAKAYTEGIAKRDISTFRPEFDISKLSSLEIEQKQFKASEDYLKQFTEENVKTPEQYQAYKFAFGDYLQQKAEYEAAAKVALQKVPEIPTLAGLGDVGKLYSLGVISKETFDLYGAKAKSNEEIAKENLKIEKQNIEIAKLNEIKASQPKILGAINPQGEEIELPESYFRYEYGGTHKPIAYMDTAAIPRAPKSSGYDWGMKDGKWGFYKVTSSGDLGERGDPWAEYEAKYGKPDPTILTQLKNAEIVGQKAFQELQSRIQSYGKQEMLESPTAMWATIGDYTSKYQQQFGKLPTAEQLTGINIIEPTTPLVYKPLEAPKPGEYGYHATPTRPGGIVEPIPPTEKIPFLPSFTPFADQLKGQPAYVIPTEIQQKMVERRGEAEATKWWSGLTPTQKLVAGAQEIAERPISVVVDQILSTTGIAAKVKSHVPESMQGTVDFLLNPGANPLEGITLKEASIGKGEEKVTKTYETIPLKEPSYKGLPTLVGMAYKESQIRTAEIAAKEKELGRPLTTTEIGELGLKAAIPFLGRSESSTLAATLLTFKGAESAIPKLTGLLGSEAIGTKLVSGGGKLLVGQQLGQAGLEFATGETKAGLTTALPLVALGGYALRGKIKLPDLKFEEASGIKSLREILPKIEPSSRLGDLRAAKEVLGEIKTDVLTEFAKPSLQAQKVTLGRTQVIEPVIEAFKEPSLQTQKITAGREQVVEPLIEGLKKSSLQAEKAGVARETLAEFGKGLSEELAKPSLESQKVSAGRVQVIEPISKSVVEFAKETGETLGGMGKYTKELVKTPIEDISKGLSKELAKPTTGKEALVAAKEVVGDIGTEMVKLYEKQPYKPAIKTEAEMKKIGREVRPKLIEIEKPEIAEGDFFAREKLKEEQWKQATEFLTGDIEGIPKVDLQRGIPPEVTKPIQKPIQKVTIVEKSSGYKPEQQTMFNIFKGEPVMPGARMGGGGLGKFKSAQERIAESVGQGGVGGETFGAYQERVLSGRKIPEVPKPTEKIPEVKPEIPKVEQVVEKPSTVTDIDKILAEFTKKTEKQKIEIPKEKVAARESIKEKLVEIAKKSIPNENVNVETIYGEDWVDILPKSAGTEVYRVKVGDKPLADVTLKVEETTGTVPSINVYPEFQSKGIGTAMLKAVEKNLINRGVKTLQAQEVLSSSQKFWSDRGYKFSGKYDEKGKEIWEKKVEPEQPKPEVTIPKIEVPKVKTPEETRIEQLKEVRDAGLPLSPRDLALLEKAEGKKPESLFAATIEKGTTRGKGFKELEKRQAERMISYEKEAKEGGSQKTSEGQILLTKQVQKTKLEQKAKAEQKVEQKVEQRVEEKVKQKEKLSDLAKLDEVLSGKVKPKLGLLTYVSPVERMKEAQTQRTKMLSDVTVPRVVPISTILSTKVVPKEKEKEREREQIVVTIPRQITVPKEMTYTTQRTIPLEKEQLKEAERLVPKEISKVVPKELERITEKEVQKEKQQEKLAERLVEVQKEEQIYQLPKPPKPKDDEGKKPSEEKGIYKYRYRASPIFGGAERLFESGVKLSDLLATKKETKYHKQEKALEKSVKYPRPYLDKYYSEQFKSEMPIDEVLAMNKEAEKHVVRKEKPMTKVTSEKRTSPIFGGAEREFTNPLAPQKTHKGRKEVKLIKPKVKTEEFDLGFGSINKPMEEKPKGKTKKSNKNDFWSM